MGIVLELLISAQAEPGHLLAPLGSVRRLHEVAAIPEMHAAGEDNAH
jgi:hypothetical protein